VGDDRLIKAEHQAHPDSEILLTTHEGKALRALATDVRATGRSSQGVRGIALAKKDRVIGMILVSPQMKKDGIFLFTATEFGNAKRTETDEYRLQTRGGKGVIAMKLTEKMGKIVATMAVHDGDELIAITEKGVIIRCQVDAIRDTGRATQGVKLIRVDEGDKVATCARILEREVEDIAEDGEGEIVDGETQA
jgi:DNA gyrase subunit A